MHPVRSIRAFSILLLTLALPMATAWGCAGTQEPPPDLPSGPSTESSAVAEPALPPLPKGHVWRVEVMRVMSPGMGSFLQRLDVREKLDGDGRFIGFEILRLKGDPTFWQGSELRTGDVITSVNGVPVEHYKDVFKVWQSLATVTTLEVSYTRNGKPMFLRLEIHDEGEDAGAIRATTAAAASSAWPGATPAASSSAPAPAGSSR